MPSPEITMHTALDRFNVVTVPGLHGSGPEHWQSRWEALHPSFRRVEQRRWDTPNLDEWSATVASVLEEIEGPVLLAAHSFGCIASVHATFDLYDKIAGALLVAPADPEKFLLSGRLINLRLRYPAVVIGSDDDPWMESSRAARWARHWGCAFVNAGPLGHINAESGLGDWELGLKQLHALAEIAAMSDLARLG